MIVVAIVFRLLSRRFRAGVRWWVTDQVFWPLAAQTVGGLETLVEDCKPTRFPVLRQHDELWMVNTRALRLCLRSLLVQSNFYMPA